MSSFLVLDVPLLHLLALLDDVGVPERADGEEGKAHVGHGEGK